MTPNTVIADFYEDLRMQVTQQLADKGVTVPPGLDAERTIHFFLNLQLRTLRPQPRKVYWSDVLKGRTLSPEYLAVINKIAAISEAGGDLNPYLSERLKTKPGYHDRLLNDWGLLHLHLGGTTVGPKGFTPRSEDLLYVYPQPTEIYLLDVLKHGASFGDTQLVEILHRNWPSLLAKYQLGGPKFVVKSGPSSSEIVEARSRGLQPLVTVSDGSVHMPFGGGISTSGLNLRIGLETDDLLDRARRYERLCRQEADGIRAVIEAQTGRRLEKLQLKVMWIDADLIVVETQVNIGIWMPGQQPPRAEGQ